MVSDSVTQAQNDIGEAQQQAIKTITEQQGISIQKIKNQTAESEDNLKNTIRVAEQIKTDLDTEVENATPIKQGLDDSNTAAIKTKVDLDKSNTIADQIKAELEVLNTTASKTKTNLDGANKTATDLTGTLENEISEGIQTKIDIQTTGETAMSNLQAEATKQQEFIKTSIDDTLSISGKAADAAVTGKKIDSLKEDLDNKITKFYASNQGETHITDSDNGKIQDMMLYGKSEQNQYKGINLLPTGIRYREIIEVSIPKGTRIFWATDGTPALGGNFRFYNEDKTQETWFGIDSGKTAMTSTMNIDAKYMEFLVSKNQSVKTCLGIGDDPVYEPYTGGQPSPSPDYPQEIKSVVNPTVKVSSEDETESQTVTLPYTLNAIPVSSGGNVTIDGQQYIADYVDVERGKLVKRVYEYVFSGEERWTVATDGAQYLARRVGDNPGIIDSANDKKCLCSCLIANIMNATRRGENYISTQSFDNTCRVWVSANVATSKLTGEKVFLALIAPEEISLTQEEIRAFKGLAAYYPVTNVNVASEQLDGYTVFNYPVSMKNGWNYVKQQLNDNRDYIYDMDIQSAEAYVNSEYAVALTELEV